MGSMGCDDLTFDYLDITRALAVSSGWRTAPVATSAPQTPEPQDQYSGEAFRDKLTLALIKTEGKYDSKQDRAVAIIKELRRG